jgi:hypothetical protein
MHTPLHRTILCSSTIKVDLHFISEIYPCVSLYIYIEWVWSYSFPFTQIKPEPMHPLLTTTSWGIERPEVRIEAWYRGVFTTRVF